MISFEEVNSSPPVNKTKVNIENVKNFLATYADKAVAEVRLMNAKAELAKAETEEVRARIKSGDLAPPISMNKKLLSSKTG